MSMMVNRLREVRVAKGFSQTKFAARLTVHPSLVSAVEHGRQAPYPRFRRRSARVLGVSERELFGEEAVKV